MADSFLFGKRDADSVTINLGYSFGKDCMHGHYNAGGILFGNYRVPQQSGPRQDCFWQGFHSNQDPDRIVFGKGSTAIRTQTGLFLARVPQQSGPRQDCFWQGFHNNQEPDRIVLARVPQQSGPRRNSVCKSSTRIKIQTGFAYREQYPDRILTGKGYTGINIQTGF